MVLLSKTNIIVWVVMSYTEYFDHISMLATGPFSILSIDIISLFFSPNRTWTLLKVWTYNYIRLPQRSSPQINLHAGYQISETVFS